MGGTMHTYPLLDELPVDVRSTFNEQTAAGTAQHNIASPNSDRNGEYAPHSSNNSRRNSLSLLFPPQGMKEPRTDLFALPPLRPRLEAVYGHLAHFFPECAFVQQQLQCIAINGRAETLVLESGLSLLDSRNKLDQRLPSSEPTSRWARGKLIDRSTLGHTYIGLDTASGAVIAIKQADVGRGSDEARLRQDWIVGALKNECTILSELDHPNIVAYLDCEDTPERFSAFLEYVPGDSIGNYLRYFGRFEDDTTKFFTEQILAGLEYLHACGVVHRDLKSDSVLVSPMGTCKLTSFALSKRVADVHYNGSFTPMQGTVFWMAPEVVSPKERGYSAKIDVWSTGCVVLEMWSGERPWAEDDAVGVMLKLYANTLCPPVPDTIGLSSYAIDFRNKCFAANPEERLTAGELRKHRYLTLPPIWKFTPFVHPPIV